MTVAEILGAFPGEAARFGPGEREKVGDLSAAVAVRAVEIGTHRYAASFLFNAEGRLRAVHLRLADMRGGVGPAYDEIAARLSKEYGPPMAVADEASASVAWARRASWATHESLIDLQGWQAAQREAHVLSLDVRGGDVRPLDEGSVALTYRSANRGPLSSK